MTIPAFPTGGAQGAPGGHRPPQRNSSRMIGGCAGASTASAAAIAGPQVRLGVGWNCALSQATSGEATAEATGSEDDGAEDVAAHPATTAATSAREITSILIALRTVRRSCRFPRARAIRGPGPRRATGETDHRGPGLRVETAWPRQAARPYLSVRPDGTLIANERTTSCVAVRHRERGPSPVAPRSPLCLGHGTRRWYLDSRPTRSLGSARWPTR